MLKSEVVSGKALNLERSFQIAFERAGSPKSAGMFANRRRSDTEFFFSPGAERISRVVMAVYGGYNCAAPKRSQVELIVGDTELGMIAFTPESSR